MPAALDLLRACLTPHGFLASPTDRANYRRVWARDGVICGLAGLPSGDAALARGLRDTLRTLAAHTGPQGQIPSNVSIEDGETTTVSYGGLAGRVDAGAWFVLGAARYAAATGDRAFAAEMAPAAEGALGLLDAWEFNARHLVYVPQSGDWADEYDLHGYLLMDQVLRLLALRAWAPFAPDPAATRAKTAAVHRTIEATFWPAAGGDADAAYHPDAYRRAWEEGGGDFPFAALTPGGYARRFDGLGSALALLAGLWPDRAGRLMDHALGLAARTAPGLVPAFAPAVTAADPAWAALVANHRDRFSNRPGHYHNGGCWPMVNGWWAAALAAHGRGTDAEALAAAIGDANAAGSFPEYLDAYEGRPLGTAPLAWSAAASVMAGAAIRRGAGPVAATEEAFASPDAPAPDASGPVDVVVAGEVLVDLLSAVPADGLAEAPAFERYFGGSAANCAANLGRLGLRTALVATVGDDGFGRFLTASAQRTGVQARFRVAPGTPTSVALVTRTTGTPDFALYRHADCQIGPDQLPDDLLGRARLFHISGFALSRAPARLTLLDAAARAHRLGTPLSIDLNFAPRTDDERRDQQAAARAFLALRPLAKASRDDVHRLLGRPVPDDEAVAWLRSAGAALVCLTRGAEGALVASAEGSAEVAATPVPHVADATGAGDAFWAGFLAAWLRGEGQEAAARAGSRLAARKLAHVGPLPDRLEAPA